MCFKRDKRESFTFRDGDTSAVQKDWDHGYDLCDMCFVNIQQEITFAKMGRS